MSDFTRRLTELREQRKFSRDELAQRLNISMSTLTNLETGYCAPSDELLEQLRDLFCVTINYLKGAGSDMGIADPLARSIPVLNDLSKNFSVISESDVIEHLYVDALIARGHKYFSYKMTGNSMDLSRINDGDYLLIRAQKYAENEDIVAVRLDDNYFVRLFTIRKGVVTLSPNSSNEKHKPITFQLETRDFEILGKVVRAVINF